LAVGSGSRAAAAPRAPEYDLKAAFLYNFAHFVEWPPDAFAARDSPIVIGVLEPDPFGPSLDRMVAGSSVGGRRLVVRRYRSAEEIDDCHILFIGRAAGPDLDRVLSSLDGASTLTVGEDDDFTDGGMIQFVHDDKKLRLRINSAAARSARLTISSKLLRQAEIVDGRSDG
jgi:hypothetical protein